MNAFEKFINFLQGTMTRPTPYGWFHFIWIFTLIIVGVLFCYFLRKSSDKQCRIIVLVAVIIMALLEIFKQLVLSYNPITDTWEFLWAYFPFYFCSMPIFVGGVAVCLKKGKVQNALYCFLATYSMFGGIGVYMFPEAVFKPLAFLNYQSMIHHAIMIILACYLLSANKVEKNYKTILKALYVFLILVAMAVGLNVVFHYTGVNCNVFDISPYQRGYLAIFSELYGKVPYPVYLGIYVVGFTVIAYIIILIAKLCDIIYKKINKRTGV